MYDHQRELRAVMLSILLPDDRKDLHNVYSLRAKRQERQAASDLGYTGPRDNVVNLGARRPPEPPETAA